MFLVPKKVRKTILISTCVHGDEQVGLKVFNEFSNGQTYHYKYKTILSNPLATQMSVRYLDKDLNRSFPGDEFSQYYEERQAATILKYHGHLDTVIDIHQSYSNMPPIAIIRAKTPCTETIINCTKIAIVIDESYNNTPLGNQITHQFENGICLEYPQLDNPNQVFPSVKSDLDHILNNRIQSESANYYHIFMAIHDKPNDYSLKNMIKLTWEQKIALCLDPTRVFLPIFVGEPAYSVYCLLITPNIYQD